MIYDKLYGLPDEMAVERMVAAALGIKNYRRQAAGDKNERIQHAFNQLVAKARQRK